MEIREFGKADARTVLIQPVDEYDLAAIGSEVGLIREATEDFRLITVKVNDWNTDLSPWEAPPVFGTARFGAGAPAFLDGILSLCADRSRTYGIGGYSLAGLFALWAACQTNVFAGVAAASPSIWFPRFTDYMRERPIRCRHVYLSLGDREERTRSPVMAAVGTKIREAYDVLCAQGVGCVLEWNEGNHFREPDRRTAKAFVRLLNEINREG